MPPQIPVGKELPIALWRTKREQRELSGTFVGQIAHSFYAVRPVRFPHCSISVYQWMVKVR